MKLLPSALVWWIVPAVLNAAGIGSTGAPVKKFRLPTFNDAGFRTSLLLGEEAKMVSATQIDVRDMHFTLFNGAENAAVDTTLVAPVATVRILEQNKISVEGSGSMHIVRDDLDASGENWTYQHAEKRLVIRKNVRVVFRAELKDILK